MIAFFMTVPLFYAPHALVAQVQSGQVTHGGGRRPVAHRAGRLHRHHTDSIAENSHGVKHHALVRQVHGRAAMQQLKIKKIPLGVVQ